MKRRAGIVGAMCLLVCLAASAYAQEQGGSIQGVVKDASGAVLPGATVEAKSPSVVGTNSVTSDAAGAYRFPALPPGTYELTVTLQGFTTIKMENVQLLLGQVLKVDFAMQLGSLAEDVQVTAESPLIDVKQNAASASITKELIELK